MESCFMSELIEFLVRVVDARLDGLDRYGILNCFLMGLGAENWGSSLGLNVDKLMGEINSGMWSKVGFMKFLVEHCCCFMEVWSGVCSEWIWEGFSMKSGAD